MGVTVVGADGQVGSALRLLHRDGEGPGAITWLGHAGLDVADARAVAGHPALAGPRGGGDCEVLINLAARTDVDAQEADPERAREVNAVAPGLLARRCAAEGARIIHLSTDYVFGAGAPRRALRPGDPTGPLNVYGRTKLAGEEAVRAAGAPGWIVRTSWVHSGALLPGHRDFTGVMMRLAAAGECPAVVADQHGCPTYAGDLAATLLRLAAVPAPAGVARTRHVAGDGVATWFAMAREIYAACGADPGLVRPTDTAGHPRPAARPGWSALASDVALPGWRSGVRRAVAGTLRAL